MAEASPLTKSAINYYFASLDEIIDLAMAAHVEAMLGGLRTAAGQHTDPYQRLHAVIQGYLDTFADRPHAAFLWFEYWIAVSRRGTTGPAAGAPAGPGHRARRGRPPARPGLRLSPARSAR